MTSQQAFEPMPGKLYKTSMTRFFYDKGYTTHNFVTYKFEPGTILFFVTHWWLEETEQYQLVWIGANKILYSEHKRSSDFNSQFKIIT